MNRWLRELFSEKGSVSSMRVMAMLCVLTAIALAFLGKDTNVLIFLTAGMAGKVSQKWTESKDSNPQLKETDAELK